MIGLGFAHRFLSFEEIRSVVVQALETWDLDRKHILVIVPDRTRVAHLPMLFQLLHQELAGKSKSLDFLVALGTHAIMSEEAINHLFGLTSAERTNKYARTRFLNHRWDLSETFVTLGVISPEETLEISGGMLSAEVPVRINKLVLEYDILLVCGPVFPHEVVGFSGGSKYFCPGISSAEIINYTHWLGALLTSYAIIGVKNTPTRAVIERVADMIPTPKLNLALVASPDGLHGVYAGDMQTAWSAAVDLSAQVHIRYMDHPFYRVLSIMPERYDDLWTGAKGMYKLEPIIADGGEVVIYAPHISEFSYTHGKTIEAIGYHVRDYFVKQWEQFKNYPWGVLAHSTHLRGMGSFDHGVESPRIRVTLATGISRERCENVGLGYLDPETIRIEEWTGREDEGILVVPEAGDVLYRRKNPG